MSKYYLEKTGYRMLEAFFAEGIESGDVQLATEVIIELDRRNRRDFTERMLKKYIMKHPMDVSADEAKRVISFIHWLRTERDN